MYKLNNFHYVGVLLDMLYGIEMQDEDLEELGLVAWELIGNKNIALYRHHTCINSSDYSVQLPCNLYSIEAVTACYEDWNRVTNYTNNGDYKSSFIENRIEAEKDFTSPYYISGKLLKYKQVGDTLYFNQNYGRINILYTGLILDDEGLPELTDKEAKAIATYIAYVDKYKEGLRTNNGDLIRLASDLEAKWLKQCDQARVTDLSQNDMNQILDAKDSWNRHTYGYSFKPIK